EEMNEMARTPNPFSDADPLLEVPRLTPAPAPRGPGGPPPPPEDPRAAFAKRLRDDPSMLVSYLDRWLVGDESACPYPPPAEVLPRGTTSEALRVACELVKLGLARNLINDRQGTFWSVVEPL